MCGNGGAVENVTGYVDEEARAMKHVLAFVAGFVGTLLFHQGLIGLLHALGVIPFAPFNLTPTWPLGVPQVFSLAFWGGVWGIVLAAVLWRRRGTVWWGGWIVLGGIAPTAVALLVVFPLKEIPVSVVHAMLGVLLNGFWGLGTALLLRAFRRLAAT